MSSIKFFIVTTIPASLGFFRGQYALWKRYFEVTAISSQKDKLSEFGASEGIKTYCIPMRRPISIFYDLVCLFKFIFYFYREKPVVVHGNTPKASFLSMLAAKLVGVPARIYMCHGLRYQGYKGIMRRLLVAMEKLSCLCATEVLCVSNGVRLTLISDKVCNPTKCKVVGHGSVNGVDLESFDPVRVDASGLRAEIGIPETDFVFLFVGRIVKDKGINELVASFDKLSKSYSNVSLLLIGPEEGEINPISKETSLCINSNTKIYCLGRKKDVKPYMIASDVFVLPSYREGFGMVLIEAGALGKPCITTDITGCNEIIVHGKNGMVVPPKDESALYEAMENCLLHPEDIGRMAAMARPMIASRYDRKIVQHAFLKEYLNIIEKNRPCIKTE